MRKELFAIPIDWISEDELIRRLKTFITNGKSHQITTVNPEFIVTSQDDAQFTHILQASDLSLADGTGIVLAQEFFDSVHSDNRFVRWAHYIGTGLRYIFSPNSFTYKRITGVRLTNIILGLSVQEHWRIFLLGAAPGVAQQAAEVWESTFPGVVIAGISSANPDDKHIIEEIKTAKPDVLLVAYGAPKQEFFIANHKEHLKIPIMVGVGGTFDYAAQNIRLAPSWMRSLGLEWLARLIQQPKRFNRILRATFTFSSLVVAKDKK